MVIGSIVLSILLGERLYKQKAIVRPGNIEKDNSKYQRWPC